MQKTISPLILAILMMSCNTTPTYNDPIPDHDNFSIDSKYVNEARVINVWTPSQYKETNDSLPVLYMPDGGIQEDFPHIANTLDKLIKDKSIPPFILVGIQNTERGRDLTGYSEVEADAQYCPLTDGAKNFRAFITDELVAEINNKYRTTTKKGIIGESLAGLFVVETFFLKPESFDFYIAMDPSLWWNDHYLMKNADRLLGEFPDKDIKLWFAGSGAQDISQYTNKVAISLKNSAPNNVVYRYSDEPNEKHNTIFRATKEKAIIWSLNENK